MLTPQQLSAPIIDGEAVAWTCPRCSRNRMEAKKEDWSFHSSAEFTSYCNELKNSNDYDFDIDYYSGFFAGILRCPGKACNEVVAVCGNTKFHGYDDGGTDEEGAQVTGAEIFAHFPTYFSKSPPIISIPDHCPDDIADLCRGSFNLFWNDVNACANRIRHVIETFLTVEGIEIRLPATSEKALSLYQRILLFAYSEALKQIKRSAKTFVAARKERQIFVEFFSITKKAPNTPSKVTKFNIGKLPSYRKVFLDQPQEVHFRIFESSLTLEQGPLLRQSEYFHRLTALRILGNLGSHDSQQETPLTKDDVIAAYELLESLLDDYYNKRQDRLDTLQRSLIQKRSG